MRTIGMVSNIGQLPGCYSFTYRWKQITTDLYVNPTDSYQYVYTSLCHPYHCKKGIPYSQALRRNKSVQILILLIGDVMNLEKRLLERSYSEREVRKQILRVFWRDSQVDRESNREEQSEITFNFTFYPVFQNVKKLIAELRLLFIHDVAHKQTYWPIYKRTNNGLWK